VRSELGAASARVSARLSPRAGGRPARKKIAAEERKRESDRRIVFINDVYFSIFRRGLYN
jgi:hypothetical protein